MLPTLSKNQSLVFGLLSLLALYWMLSAKPAVITDAGNKKAISPLRVVLSYVLANIILYVIILMFARFANKRSAGKSSDAMSDLLNQQPQDSPSSGAAF
jgi:hypothetical protein